MANNSIECPVDFVLINGNKARITAGSVFVLMVIFLFTNFLAIPIFLLIDFFVRGFKLGKYSPLNFLSDKLIAIFSIQPKLTDQAPKRFAAKIGFLFSFVIMLFLVFQLPVVSLIAALVMATFALLESFVGFCAGCHVYSFYSKLIKKKSDLYSA
ncbi:MAG: DUF4395 domain-containing protein [Ferruginibacter sp.]